MTFTPIVPPELLEKLAADKCVAYVGAGLSAGAGLPLWAKLLGLIHLSVPVTDFSASAGDYEHWLVYKLPCLSRVYYEWQKNMIEV